MNTRLPIIIILIVLLFALGGGYWLYQNQSSRSDSSASPKPTATVETAATTTPTTATPGRSTVTIEEFGDYQCPPCGNVHPSLKKIKAEYGDRIRFVFHHFPLTKIHANAQPAALAAVAAGFQGRFWEMHDELYSSQEAWSEVPDMTPHLLSLARKLNLDVTRFIADMTSPRALAVVISDQQQGLARGVNSTPTIIINGNQVAVENFTYEKLREQVDREIRNLK